ncbi:MAG: 6-bladed beta-propeller [Tannerellaceae bacterium]|nr:6-bladed beta-propeller [Tannerellaceae bacterium]
MKRRIYISGIILLIILTGCTGGNKYSMEDLIIVDINKSYPDKELILQDFMEVEYIALETTDKFLTQGVVKAIGKNLIVVTNWINDGNIFLFDRTGKALRKINRFGQSGEEYSQITEIILDEDKNELFVIDYPVRKILAYNLQGDYKRSFNFLDTSYYTFIFNYDRDNLICYRSYLPIDNEQAGHLIISKQDGSVTREIPIPFKEIKTPVVIMAEEDIHVTPSFQLMIPYNGNWILVNTSSDTIYNYSPDYNLTPLMVRTPSIHFMESEVFLFLNIATDRYYFMQTMKKEFDFEKRKGFPLTNLVYDKEAKSIFKYTVYNDDFSGKKQVYLSSRPGTHEIATWQSLDAPNLVETYENGQLKGKLKEMAAKLDEESNPVIMLVMHKK